PKSCSLISVRAHNHQRVKLNAAAPAVSQAQARAFDLMLSCAIHYLHSCFGLAHHRRRAYRVCRKHAARWVDGQIACHFSRARFDEATAFATLAEKERFGPEHFLNEKAS